MSIFNNRNDRDQLRPRILKSTTLAASFGSGISLDTQAQAIVNAMTPAPSSTDQGYINTFVLAMKTLTIGGSSAWADCDSIYVFDDPANQTNSLLDWKNPAGTALVKTGTVTFTTNQGNAGDGSTGFFQGPTNLSAFTKFTQNAAHMALWSLTAGQGGYDIGSIVDVSDPVGIACRNGSDNAIARLCANGGASTASWANATASGFHMVTRSDAANVNLYKNGVSQGAIAQASAALPNEGFAIFKVFNAFSSRQLAFVSIGGDMSTVASGFYNAVQALLHSRGTV